MKFQTFLADKHKTWNTKVILEITNYTASFRWEEKRKLKSNLCLFWNRCLNPKNYALFKRSVLAVGVTYNLLESPFDPIISCCKMPHSTTGNAEAPVTVVGFNKFWLEKFWSAMSLITLSLRWLCGLFVGDEAPSSKFIILKPFLVCFY